MKRAYVRKPGAGKPGGDHFGNKSKFGTNVPAEYAGDRLNHLAYRYAHSVIMRGADECWGWKKAINPQPGYPECRYGVGGKSKMVRAHRVAYEMMNGPIAPGMFVLHSCDNRVCTNPSHLSLGDHQANMDDMMRKGRAGRSPSCPEEILREAIRNTPGSQREVAKKFGVSRWIVRSARGEGKLRWKKSKEKRHDSAIP